MVRLRSTLLIMLALVVACAFAQGGQTPDGQSTSRAQPDTPGLPPDAPVPDQGTMATPPAKSAAKRTLNKLDPHCIDAIFHTCWSSPAATPQKPMSEDDQLVGKDIEVGYYYLRDKNYRAAESRLKEAVEDQAGFPGGADRAGPGTTEAWQIRCCSAELRSLPETEPQWFRRRQGEERPCPA